MVSLNLIGRQGFILHVTGTFDLMTPKYGASMDPFEGIKRMFAGLGGP